uniref:ATPase putative n=1 Tax=Albugo laibachii Nc14 TaxID=890382 RepID=F0VZC5_9STRA|nr:ATPase putative [Albugo laibachii Nc14]|eukprot:CCA14155.1 ATPase putative [Albugo laibachii Nc14]
MRSLPQILWSRLHRSGSHYFRATQNRCSIALTPLSINKHRGCWLSSIAAAVTVTGTSIYYVEQENLVFLESYTAPDDSKKENEYDRTIERLRNEITEFRNRLSQSGQLPPHYPIPKLSITRINAPNGIPTLRIAFNCPSFVQTQLILGNFVASLQNSGTDTSIQVHASDSGGPDAPLLNYLLRNGNGSFHMLPNIRGGTALDSSFVLYKDEALSSGEINAVVDAYKALFSGHNVAAFKHELMLRTRAHSRHQKQQSGSNSKESALEQLQSLGLEVYNSKSEDESALDWNSLAGYDDVKKEIEDTIVLALQNPDLYDQIARSTRCRYESNRPRAVLFEGPPGTGKTLTARIIAQQAGIPMIHIPVEAVVSKWYGESEKKLSTIFDACEQLDGAIIFIDEIDALAGDRSGGIHEASRRILSVLLQKVEGFESAQKTTVICATNRKEDLDAALLSRFDLCIRYDLPDQSTRTAIFKRYAKQLSDEELEKLSSLSSGLSCRAIKEICEYAERKWASQVLRGEKSGNLPTIDAYLNATNAHVMGVGHQAPPDVYEA